MSEEHQHCWIIASVRALVWWEVAQQRVPMGLRAELHCAGCSAALYELTMEQVGDEIAAGHVQEDSIAQWASIAPLFNSS